MTKLTNKEVELLKYGVNQQFAIWESDERRHHRKDVKLYDETCQGIIKQLESKRLPDPWMMDNEVSWDLMCALYDLYPGPNAAKLPYTAREIAHLNRKIMRHPMKDTIEAVNTAWNDVR